MTSKSRFLQQRLARMFRRHGGFRNLMKRAQSAGVAAWVLALAPEDRFAGWPFGVSGGAPTTSANLANLLVTTYGRSSYIPAHERSMAKFYNETESWTAGGKPVGAEHKWGINTKDSHSAAAVAESGDVPTFNPPGIIQASLTAKTTAASVAWSDFFLWVSQLEGTIQTVTGINSHVKMTVRNFMSAMNRHSLGHGTGRMAVVESATSASTTVPVRNPEGAWQLRPGMMIGFYDLDTGGTLQGAVETIQTVNARARTFVIGNARSLTAGWGIYKASSTTATEYGIVPMGLRGINDNGGLAATLFGQTRSSNPVLNATVITSGALQSYSEKLVRQGIDSIGDANDMEPTEIWCNTGIVAEHYNFLSGSRVWSMGAGNAVPNYPIGAKGLPVFVNGDKEIPFRVDRDLPARELHIICKELYRKHVLREPNWVGDDIGVEGSSTPYLMQAPGTGTNTYALQKIAAFAAALNYGHLMPIAGCKIDQVADEQKAGDA